MSKQQLAEILKIGAQNPPPANAKVEMMRTWAEGITSHTPLAENVRIERVKFGPCAGDLILPKGGDTSRLVIYYHGGGFFFFSSRTYRVTTTNLARARDARSSPPTTGWPPKIPRPPRMRMPSESIERY
jgi:epsilon-lactone hydrolase